MGSIDYVPHGRLALGDGSTLRVDDAGGMRLYVWQGTVWVTQEGDSRDVLLKDGDSFQLDHAGAALISPLGKGALVSLAKVQHERDLVVSFPIPAFAIR
jgi:hypothetical protein